MLLAFFNLFTFFASLSCVVSFCFRLCLLVFQTHRIHIDKSRAIFMSVCQVVIWLIEAVQVLLLTRSHTTCEDARASSMPSNCDRKTARFQNIGILMRHVKNRPSGYSCLRIPHSQFHKRSDCTSIFSKSHKACYSSLIANFSFDIKQFQGRTMLRSTLIVPI